MKIIDFGFSKFFNENEKLFEACGTPNYVGNLLCTTQVLIGPAPDVLVGNGYDQKADVWSVGIIFHLL